MLRKNKKTPNLLALLLISAASSGLGSLASAHDRISTKVTWEREISPIVQARCVSCHREGGRAPMALTTYEEARPWARAIKEEVLTRRMPKWHVVRGYGDFQNDRSLSPFEIALFASWADGGAPRRLPGATVPEGPTMKPGVRVTPESRGRNVTVPCTARRWPAGRVVALKPTLTAGGDIRIDAGNDPVLWIREFDPAFVETYVLRRPLTISQQTPVRTAASPATNCTVELSYTR